MTVIATDGHWMAADGLCVHGDLIVETGVEKIRRAKDGSLVGCAGERSICEMVLRWFEEGEDPEKRPEVGERVDGESVFDALILRPDGKCQFMDDRFEPCSRVLPTAIGSGSEVALGLMVAGKSPKEAVKTVAEHVVTVGGKIICLALGK